MTTLRNATSAALLLFACSDPAAPDDAAGTETSVGSSTGSSATATGVLTIGEDSTGALATSSSGDDGGDSSDAGNDGPVLDVGSHEVPPGCANGAEAFVLLFDIAGGRMLRFDPETLALEELGVPNCPAGYFTIATAMDRSGKGYLMMLDENGERRILVVDPETLDCQDTGFVDPIDQNLLIFSLGFVADGPDAETETLYVSGVEGMELQPDMPGVLATMDTDTFVPTLVGEFPLESMYALNELRGTGEGRMYALFYGPPTLLTEVEPSDANLLSETEVMVQTGQAWTFALWGGKLLLFTNTSPSGKSQLYGIDLATGAAEPMIDDLGFTVIGAASSTCAPYEPRG